MEPHLPHLPSLYALVKDTFHGHFGIFCMPILPLGFPINRGGEELSTLTQSLIQYAMHDLASFLPHTKEFRRAERLSEFRWELVLDGEALPDS